MEKELYDVLVDGRDFGQKHYHFSREKSAEDFFSKLVKKVFETAGVDEDNFCRTMSECMSEKSMNMGEWMVVSLQKNPLDKMIEEDAINYLVRDGL